MSKPEYVYIASSWRCTMQEAVVLTLRAVGIACYDFKNLDDAKGFGWHEVMPGYITGSESAKVNEYLESLDHPRAIEGFENDFGAMQKADTFVLVLPCNRSAHLELGWAVGQGKRTAILLNPDKDGNVVPELMYKMVDYVAPNLFQLLGWLGVED